MQKDIFLYFSFDAGESELAKGHLGWNKWHWGENSMDLLYNKKDDNWYMLHGYFFFVKSY